MKIYTNYYLHLILDQIHDEHKHISVIWNDFINKYTVIT